MAETQSIFYHFLVEIISSIVYNKDKASKESWEPYEKIVWKTFSTGISAKCEVHN